MGTTLENWKNFWNQLGMNQRVSIVVSVFVVVVGMVGLFIWAQRPNMRLLYGSVSSSDAAAIVNQLDAQGIPYEIRSGGTAIFVPEEQVYKARMDIASQGLLQGDSVGFEIFDKGSFGISDFVQRTNFIRAVQGELARTIRNLNGVNDARVMVVMPDNKLLLVNKDVETTASVFVDVGGGSIGGDAVRSIQALVANAVEGLRRDNVAVVDNRGNVLSKDNSKDDLMGASSNVVEYRQNLENYFSDKVQTMLEDVIGKGRAVVRVSADIASSQISRMEEDFNEDGAVLRRQTSREESSSTIEGTGGVASLTVDDEEAAGTGTNARGARTDEESLNRDQAYEIDRVVTNVVEGPGKVERLTASVFVAARSIPAEVEGGEPVIQNRTPDELERLRQMVANALGIALEDPKTGSVVVQEVVFDTTPQAAAFAVPPASKFNPAELLQHGEKLIGGIVALAIFIVFLNMLKRTNQHSSVLDELARVRETHNTTSNGHGASMVTPELLNDLIQQKPENAGAVLRNWLSGKPSE